jgi:lipid-binding SYLF domain-containing protein
MKVKQITTIWIALSLILIAGSVLPAQGRTGSDIKDEAKQSRKAARVFREIMNTPDSKIPSGILDEAECVAVFPDVIKAGFIFGGRGGRGVVSCRTPLGWSAPAYLNLGGGSFGLQIGAQSTDFVMLFMSRDGINSLLSSKFTLGADASAAAGPVGRQAGAATDLKLDAQILSYSRSKGLFAGLELKGVVIEPDEGDLRDVYGENAKPKEILQKTWNRAPAAVRDFPRTLARYSGWVISRLSPASAPYKDDQIGAPFRGPFDDLRSRRTAAGLCADIPIGEIGPDHIGGSERQRPFVIDALGQRHRLRSRGDFESGNGRQPHLGDRKRHGFCFTRQAGAIQVLQRLSCAA